MSYLVDSDWVAEYLKGREPAIARLPRLAPDGLAISLITHGEIYDGIYYGREPERHEQIFQRFLAFVDVLPLTELSMQRFARVRGYLRQSGQRIGDMDIVIAATAMTHGLTLLTYNLAHFSRIPGLALYQPSDDQDDGG
ncbi:MAG: type II toxin-antitoxin system VapC family toxin [Chloroflexi bacterium]|nr:type II toxin-antitoxin system VapC family toxin [Chloroflexota bacterium]